ncbi:MAG: pitrilysin family protein [Candidatus Sericytochromatia bacterium]|nr:pitrilysin family protein [Candidatus Sericytochromatia bacterium]
MDIDSNTKPVTKVTLPNGVRVLLDEMPHAQSAALGFWVDVGSRDEPLELAGACHFLEHMLFKGTPRRSALAIAQSLEVSGGSLNAFTDKESTCFHARVLASELPEAIDVLSDMLRNSLLDSQEILREKAVVCEEIKMYADTPDDLVHELAYANAWQDHPLARPVTGTLQSVRRLSRRRLKDFMFNHYAANNLLVAVAGKFDANAVLAQLHSTLGDLPAASPRQPMTAPVFHPGRRLRFRDIEQIQMMLLTPGVPATDERRYAMTLLNSILGGGMSSRLFQEVREKRGLVYAIGTFEAMFREGGVFAVSAGMSPRNLPEVLSLVEDSLAQVAGGTVSEDELLQAKRQMRGSLQLAMEVPRHRMMRMAQDELYYGREIPIEEVLLRVEAVSLEDLRGLGQSLLRPNDAHVTLVGPVRRWPRQVMLH